MVNVLYILGKIVQSQNEIEQKKSLKIAVVLNPFEKLLFLELEKCCFPHFQITKSNQVKSHVGL